MRYSSVEWIPINLYFFMFSRSATFSFSHVSSFTGIPGMFGTTLCCCCMVESVCVCVCGRGGETLSLRISSQGAAYFFLRCCKNAWSFLTHFFPDTTLCLSRLVMFGKSAFGSGGGFGQQPQQTSVFGQQPQQQQSAFGGRVNQSLLSMNTL